jgi:hypothetical protein
MPARGKNSRPDVPEGNADRPSGQRRRPATAMLTGGTVAAVALLAVPLVLAQAGASGGPPQPEALGNAAVTTSPSPGADPGYTPPPQVAGRSAPAQSGGAGKPPAAGPGGAAPGARKPGDGAHGPTSPPGPVLPPGLGPSRPARPPSAQPRPAQPRRSQPAQRQSSQPATSKASGSTQTSAPSTARRQATAPSRPSFSAIAGPGCAGSPTHFFKTGRFFAAGLSGVLLSGGDGVCGGSFFSLPMSGSDTKGDPSLYTLWYFYPGAYQRCAIDVFIPHSTSRVLVGGAPAHYSVHDTNDAFLAGFHIYQTRELGAWVHADTITTGRPFYVRMDNTGVDRTSHGAPDHDHDAAAQIKVTCTD